MSADIANTLSVGMSLLFLEDGTSLAFPELPRQMRATRCPMGINSVDHTNPNHTFIDGDEVVMRIQIEYSVGYVRRGAVVLAFPGIPRQMRANGHSERHVNPSLHLDVKCNRRLMILCQ
jgi:hypothetical protein